MTDFFSMGGYAVYVWPAYAVTLIVLVANFWLARRSIETRRARARRYHAARGQTEHR